MAHDPWQEVEAEAQRLVAAAEDARKLPRTPPRFEEPPEGMGDLAVPTFAYAKAARKAPPEIARELAGAMPASPWFPKVEAAGGYVNFHINAAKLADATLRAVAERGDDYGFLPPNGKRLLLEHTSVNPTGPLHVGRARNSLIGDALARLLRMGGYEVTTEFLVNDIGRQMVLLAWGVEHVPESELEPPERDRDDYRLTRNYQAANARTEADPTLNRQIESMIYRLEHGDATLTQEIHGIAERILAGIRATLARLDIHFDSFFWESDLILGGKIEPVKERMLALPQVGEEGGSYFIDLAPYGVQGRNTKWFFVRKDGTSLYPTRDIAYHLDKFARCDEAIVVLGENHRLESTQLRIALKLLNARKDVEPVFYSYVSLPEGKMSMRKGVAVFVDDLIDEAVARAHTEVSKRREDLSEDRKRAIAEFVGVGALRYNIARVQAEKKITFRWDEALNFEGDSAPFLQYAHARACGILAKAGTAAKADPSALTQPAEVRLVKVLARLPSVVADCAANRRVHPLAAYAYALAVQFQRFYEDCPVLTADEPVRSARLAVVAATRTALGNALRGLGLAAPEEM
ncbi:MAG: arginine--tRNA ligase [Methanobacteriota archaeon]|nr:MAG: arginine--tRNA ligase [Euryarchaeota archaeon]